MESSLLLLFCLFTAISLSAQKGSNNARFNQKVAGVYISVSSGGAQIMQLFADGNLTFELSEEFPGNNDFHESFSNPMGYWEASGKQSLSATSYDLVFNEEGKFIGVGVAKNAIQFDEQFQRATVDCKGVLYAPGVDPFAEDARPIPGSEFSCAPMHFRRAPGNREKLD